MGMFCRFVRRFCGVESSWANSALNSAAQSAPMALIEPLEARALMSSTLRVTEGWPGQFFVEPQAGLSTGLNATIRQDDNKLTVMDNIDGTTEIYNGPVGSTITQVTGTNYADNLTLIVTDTNPQVNGANIHGYSLGGDDIIAARGQVGIIEAGDGRDKVTVQGVSYDAVFDLGNGNDSIKLFGELYGVSVYCGDGNDVADAANLVNLVGSAGVFMNLGGGTNWCFDSQYDDTIIGSGNGADTLCDCNPYDHDDVSGITYVRGSYNSLQRSVNLKLAYSNTGAPAQ
jgi:hypothetical protein